MCTLMNVPIRIAGTIFTMAVSGVNLSNADEPN
jgi:hypothetical protein